MILITYSDCIAIPGSGVKSDKSDEIQSLFANVGRYDTVKVYVVINDMSALEAREVIEQTCHEYIESRAET